MLMIFYFLINIISIYKAQAYRHGIFVDSKPLCNNLTCKGDLQHTACREFEPHKRCKDFEFLDMSRRDIKTMILGHNGIRNKIAKEWDIGNMNILHWSRELEKLSKYFLIDCQAKRDVCNFLEFLFLYFETLHFYKKSAKVQIKNIKCVEIHTNTEFQISKDISIGQNIFFSKASPGVRWVGRTIRYWYSELGYDIKSWEEFKDSQKRNVSLTEFTQMIWPTTEFLGCAAARMFDGYIATCYYHPSVSDNWNDFSQGKGCTKCSRERLTCSRDFNQLCGLDVPYNIGNHLQESTIFMWILFLNVLNIFGYVF